MRTIKKIIALLDSRERLELAGLFILDLFVSAFQLLGVGSIMPFLGLMTNRQPIHENKYLSWAFHTFGFETTQFFLFSLGLFVLLLFIFSNALISLSTWLMIRFAWSTQSRLAITLLQWYLHQPYTHFLNRNSADIGKNVLHETELLTSGTLVPLLRIGTYGLVALVIAGFLFWFDPGLAFLSMTIFGGGYLAFFLSIRRRLWLKGKMRFDVTTSRFKIVNEAFGSIKEIKVLGRESAFVSQFRKPSRDFAHAIAFQQVLKEMPRYVFETLAFGSILAIILYLIHGGSALDDIVPIVGMYAFAGYRLLPSLNQVYYGVVQLRFNAQVVETVYQEICGHHVPTLIQPSEEDHTLERKSPPPTPLPFQRYLELKNVTFTYPNNSEPTLFDINIAVPRGGFIGIVGQTGSGKTTLIDLILGLLSPQKGSIFIDNTVLEKGNIRAWQKKLGYVPQDIFLTDDTIAANISLGIPPAERDEEAIQRAAQIANIHDFVMGELPRGYDTVVGERGIRLSGGQRQRIGIARALYHDPELVILDEATSNLDQSTEASVYQAIQQTAAKKTVIMIAHRLHTVKNCDRLYLMEEGRMVAQGTFNDLLSISTTFQAMAGA